MSNPLSCSQRVGIQYETLSTNIVLPTLLVLQDVALRSPQSFQFVPGAQPKLREGVAWKKHLSVKILISTQASTKLANLLPRRLRQLCLFIPTLLDKVGLEEAIFISQLDYWLQRSKNFRIEDGCRWVWNTVDQWLEQFC